MKSNALHIFDAVLDAGIIAHIRDAFSPADVVEIGDALLASPILATLVAYVDEASLAAVSILRERADGHMLVGASNILTSDDVDAACAAGAQFLLGPYFTTAAYARAREIGAAYAPAALSSAEAIEAAAVGAAVLVLAPADVLGPDHLRHLRRLTPGAVWLAAGDISPDMVAAYASAGAAGVIVDRSLIPGDSWTQAQIITRAREFIRLWSQEKQKIAG